MTDPDALGFAGLVQLGMTVDEAWQVIHDGLADEPRALDILRNLEHDPEGQEALAWSRLQWAAHGLPPPWEDLAHD